MRALRIYVAVAFVLLCAAAVVRWNVWSFGSDTGTFAQAVANTGNAFSDGLEHGSHYRFHFSPILGALWPLLALTHSPLSLQIVQIVLLLACPFLLAALVEPYAPAPWPLRAGILALLYPPLIAGAFSEFHELAFYPPLLLALILAADRARWLLFGILALALACVREDASLDLVVIGIVFAVIGLLRRTTRERGLFLGEPVDPERLTVAGAWLTVVSGASLALYALVVLPHVGQWRPSHFYDYPFASGPVQVALAIFTHPIALFAATVTLGRVTYVLEALAPLALLPLFSRWSLLALPAFAGILLASDPSVWRMGMHYALLWAPLLLLGAAFKLASLVRWDEDDRASVWWWTAVVVSGVFLIAFNPMHPAHYLRKAAFMDVAAARSVLRCVPNDAPVAMHDEWYAHEALAYPNATVLGARPWTFEGYLVYDERWNSTVFDRALPHIRRAIASGRFSLVCARGSARAIKAAR